MITYIIIDDDAFQVDTERQRKRAQVEMRAAQRDRCEVLVSPCDSIEEMEALEDDDGSFPNGNVLFAR